MRYSTTHKQEVRKKLMASSRAVAKSGGFETTGVDALMDAIGMTGGAFYSHFPSKQALFEALVSEEMNNSADMLGGHAGSSPDHVARRLRGYLSSFHAENPDKGCALTALGSEIARSSPEVRKAVEASLKRTQKNWADRIGDADAAWALIAQCVGAVMLARVIESANTRKELLAANRRFIDQAHALEQPCADSPGYKNAD